MTTDLEDIWMRCFVLQRRLGYDFSKMNNEEKIDYIRINVLALTNELHEALRETGWKPWGSSRHIAFGAYVDELIDALHFLFNLFLVAGISPDQMIRRFHLKNDLNHQRQDHNYTGRNSNCANCSESVPTYWIAAGPISPELARRNTEVSETDVSLVWCSDTCYDKWINQPDDPIAETGLCDDPSQQVPK